jgi:uncharacterized damage-inducible protein DinB
MPIAMNRKLQSLYDLAEADRKRILDMVSRLTEEKFGHNPPDKWSISQILAHLIAAERLSLQYMKKKSLGIKEAGNSGIWEEIKFLILKVSQRLPLKYKAPKMLAESQPEKLSLSEITAQWDETRKDLKAFIENWEDHHLKKKIYKHVVSGRLNILHAVSFFREHAIHHLPQIKRLLH